MSIRRYDCSPNQVVITVLTVKHANPPSACYMVRLPPYTVYTMWIYVAMVQGYNSDRTLVPG